MGCWFWQWTLQIHGLLILAVNIADPFEWWSTCCVASSNFCCNKEWNWIQQGWILFCEEPSQNCKSTTEKNQAPKGSVWKANIDWKHYTHSSVQKQTFIKKALKFFKTLNVSSSKLLIEIWSKGCVTSYNTVALAIYIKEYLKAAKEELWKLKYFTMQKI